MKLAILIGGAGKRVGTEKPELRICGKRLIEIAFEKFSEFDPIIVCRDEAQVERYAKEFKAKFVCDFYRNFGAIAGIHSAIKHNGDTVVVAIDMPFVKKKVVEFLFEKGKELKLVDFFDYLVARSGYRDYVLNEENGDERWDNVLELRTVAEEFNGLPPQEALASFLENVALVSDVDNFKESDDKVTLITLHQAKGLEFGVVFIVGVEEGLLPHFKSLDDPYQMEEERRLCYVGITRAKRRVYLVHAFRRNLMGRSTVNKPSRFLQDIPRDLVTGGEIWQAEESKIGTEIVTGLNVTSKNPTTSLLELKSGDKVRHNQFGEGVVVSSTARGNDYEVVVAFTGVGVKKLLQSFARLEKIN
ncbi:MAG: 3'-5' exonuclease [Archaeoglobaceae archaeon]